MSRKLRMTVHNEQLAIGTIKMNSVSNAGTILIGDTCLITPQSETVTQPQPQPQLATSKQRT